MNCAECRDNLVACAEGLLDREALLECRTHLETCADCAVEYHAITRLQQRLAARGQRAADVAMVAPVMRRVLKGKKEKESIMSRIFKYRWGFGLGAAAGAAAIMVAVLLVFPNTRVTAAEVMARGAQAVARLTSLHLVGEVRTTPQDEFGNIQANCPFCTIELWKQFEPDLKWRIEKPLRVAVMDGHSTIMFIKHPIDLAFKLPKATTNALDTGWLQRIANLSNTITNELNNALAKGWKMSLAEKTGADGRTEDVVTIDAKSGLPDNDYLKNTSFNSADTRRVYVFDDQSGRLEAARVYLHSAAGDKLIFKLNRIDYNPTIDPRLWKLDLPADVSWWQNKMKKLPDNEKYAALTAEQAARAFLEACSHDNWAEAQKFMRESPVDHLTRQQYAGLEIIHIGTAFTSKASRSQFVPCKIKLNTGYVHKMNLALMKDKATGRWYLIGGY